MKSNSNSLTTVFSLISVVLVIIMLFCLLMLLWNISNRFSYPYVTMLGRLETSHTFEDYTINIYRGCVKGSYEILKNGKQISAEQGWHYQIATYGEIFPDEGELLLGKDITGDKIPNVVIVEYTGRLGPTYFSVISLGDDPELIAKVKVPMAGKLVDVNNDNVLEIIYPDSCGYFIGGWSRSLSPEPEIILKYKNGEYVFAPDLMIKKKPSEQEIDILINSLKNSDSWSDPAGPRELIQVMLDLIFSGNQEVAWQIFEYDWQKGNWHKDTMRSNIKYFLEHNKYYCELYSIESVPPKLANN